MEENESIEFSAKYGSWIAIKKQTIRSDTKPEEIAMQLASIKQMIDRKSFEVLGIDMDSLNAYSEKVTSGMRKGSESLAEAVKRLGSQESKDAVQKACNGKKELEGPAGVCLFRKTVQNLNYSVDLTPELLQKAYPNLKIPMPPGRRAKK